MHKVNIPCAGNFTIASHISLSESPPPHELRCFDMGGRMKSEADEMK